MQTALKYIEYREYEQALRHLVHLLQTEDSNIKKIARLMRQCLEGLGRDAVQAFPYCLQYVQFRESDEEKCKEAVWFAHYFRTKELVTESLHFYTLCLDFSAESERAKYQNEIGMLYFNILRDTEKAVEHLKEAVKLVPDDNLYKKNIDFVQGIQREPKPIDPSIETIPLQLFIEMADYFVLKGLCSISTGLFDKETDHAMGNLIVFEEASLYTARLHTFEQQIPAHFRFSNHPKHAYIVHIDGKIEYRYGTDGESHYTLDAPIITDKTTITLLNDFFYAWYKYLKLPQSLKRLRTLKKKKLQVLRNNKIELIKTYITTGTQEDLEVLLDKNDIAVIVDWRAYDDEIVKDCEAVLKTGVLSTEFVDDVEEGTPLGYDIFITYKEKRVRIPFLEEIGVGNRDRTIHTLNELLQPDYRIRYSIDGDTAILLPLETLQWDALVEEFGEEKIAQYFQPILPDTNFWDEDEYEENRELFEQCNVHIKDTDELEALHCSTDPDDLRQKLYNDHRETAGLPRI